MTDHLDWEHVFTAGLTQAPAHILVQISLSAAHLNFSPGLIWALYRRLLGQPGAQGKAKVLLKDGLWMSNSAMQPCRVWFRSENGCKVLRENERHQDFSRRMEDATGAVGRPPTRWFWDQVLWFLNLKRSWCHCWRCPWWKLEPLSKWQPASNILWSNILASAFPPHRPSLRPDHTDFAIDLPHGCASSCPAVQDRHLGTNQGSHWVLCPNPNPLMGFFLLHPC